jgi:hypothetical protein
MLMAGSVPAYSRPCAPLLLPLLLLSLPLHAEPLQGGAWALTLQYSVDGKQWPAAEAPRMECVLPEQASKVNSHVRRSLQVFGCRLQKLQMNGAQGEGLADCWPKREVVDLRFKAQQPGDRHAHALRPLADEHAHQREARRRLLELHVGGALRGWGSSPR